MKKYRAREGFPITDEDAAVLGPEFERIAYEEGLSPENIVRRAKNETSPLHNYFEWDDESAAHKWRKQKARTLVRSVEIEAEREQQVRGFYHVDIVQKEGEEARSEYVTLDTALSTEEYMQQILNKALNQLVSWQKTYRQYNEMFERRFGEAVDGTVQEAIDALAEVPVEA